MEKLRGCRICIQVYVEERIYQVAERRRIRQIPICWLTFSICHVMFPHPKRYAESHDVVAKGDNVTLEARHDLWQRSRKVRGREGK